MDKRANKMDATHMKKENHMHMNMNDSLKDVKKEDMWNKDMKHDMDTTKAHKHLYHHENDSTKKLNNNMLEKE